MGMGMRMTMRMEMGTETRMGLGTEKGFGMGLGIGNGDGTWDGERDADGNINGDRDGNRDGECIWGWEWTRDGDGKGYGDENSTAPFCSISVPQCRCPHPRTLPIPKTAPRWDQDPKSQSSRCPHTVLETHWGWGLLCVSLWGRVGGRDLGGAQNTLHAVRVQTVGRELRFRWILPLGWGCEKDRPPRGKVMHRIGVGGAPLYPKRPPEGRGGAEVWGCAGHSLSPFWPYNDVITPRREFWGFLGWEVGDQ